MFGVFTHAQIDKRLWAAVAHWSSKRGPEYKRRCVFYHSKVLGLIMHRCTARQTSKQQGGYVIPLSWPPIQETYDAPDVGVDSEFNLEVGSFDVMHVGCANYPRSCTLY